MNKYIIGFFIFFISLNTFSLSIGEFSQQVVRFLKEENSFETSKIDVQIKRLELDSSRENYADWKANLELNADYTYWDNEKDTTSNSSYTNTSEKHGTNAKLSLSKRFLNNPSSFSISLKRDISNENLVRAKKAVYYDTYELYKYGNYYTLGWKYPILKHDSNASSLKTYHQNILDLVTKKLSYYENQEDYLSKQLKKFLSWATYHEEVLVYQAYLQKLQNIKTHNQKDRANIQNTLLKIQTNLSETSANLQGIRQELATELNNDKLLDEMIKIDWHKSTNIISNTKGYLKKNNRDLQKIIIARKGKKLNIKYYKNQNLAKLDFTVNANQEILDANTKTTASISNKMIYTTALTFSYPLFGNITNQTELQKNQLNLRKSEISYRKKLNTINSKVRSLNISLSSNQKTLKQHLKLIRSQQRQVQTILNNYTHKSSTIKHVIDALDDLKQSQLDYINAGKSYQTNIINYDNLLDRMIEMPPEDRI